MRAILLFSHGSVQCGAEANLLELAQAMEEGSEAPIVEVGFLNYSMPDLQTAFERCVERGATTIAIVPYFLVAGKFVVEDLPAAISPLARKFSDVMVVTAAPVGFDERLAEIILDAAGTARAPEAWLIRKPIPPEFCRDSPRCPTHATEFCPRSGGTK